MAHTADTLRRADVELTADLTTVKWPRRWRPTRQLGQ